MTDRRTHVDPGPDWVCLGQVTGAIGVRGEIRVKSFTTDPKSLQSYGALTVLPGGETMDFKLLRVVKDGLAMRAEGVTDRDAAEALRGKRLYVPRARLPEPDEDDFYHADLIGLRVEDAAGQELGHIRAVHDFGAGDVLDVAAVAGGQGFMLPFTREAVTLVDIKGGRIVAVPPEPATEDDRPEPEE
ncbi:ribosome maturation factor RimM [Govanella unica]|uniref:Ribosome maturation factor RimM n=1 Tax=Govanella unica TaxID=2975056 RepID=A0A9X3TVF2_9PROT|nr:ribosome maturation factor RimM [Govania unica]MDA5192726.1 ribosome maturation factor RimM [Govania unica]